MYKTLKKTISAILPKSFIVKNELALRSVFGLFHKGSTHQCNICEHKLKSFIEIKKGDLLCPFCGSISRNRRLWVLLNENDDLKGNVLHFSPSRSIYRKLKTSNTITYFSSDFENEFLADYRFDITAIEQENETFDLIICYHILEHIEDDQKAMYELYRVLKPNGIIYIQTPFKEGEIYENDNIKTPEERLEHFGQEDHVRVYSLDGLKKRLESSKFKVEIKNYQESDSNFYNGLKPKEVTLKVTKG